MKVTLAKALKLKKRLTNQIAVISRRIQKHNCNAKGGVRQENVIDLMELRNTCIDKLVELKLVIFNANKNIQKQIFEISELKGYITLLGRLDTREGKQVDTRGGWATTEAAAVEYESQISYAEVQGMVGFTQKTIDKTQDDIDQYNHDCRVDVDDALTDGSLF